MTFEERNAAQLSEAMMLVKVFFGDDVTINSIGLVERPNHDPLFNSTLYDHRRKSPKGKSFYRYFYDCEDLLRYAKKLCSARNKYDTSDEACEVTKAEYARVRELREMLEQTLKHNAYTGYVMVSGKKGVTPSGGVRRPFIYGSLKFEESGYSTRTFSSLEALEEFIPIYLACCITALDYKILTDINQRLLKQAVKGRFGCTQALGKAPVFHFHSWSGWGGSIEGIATIKEARIESRKILAA